MSFEDLVKLTRELGFPIAVAGYVLFRLDRGLQDVKRELIKLRYALLPLLSRDEDRPAR